MTKKTVAEGAAFLAARDRDLARLLKADGPPPLWARKPGFQSLVRIILEQQVSLASAKAVYLRLAEVVDPFTPDRFVRLGSEFLRQSGITRQKAAYCIHVAEALQQNLLDLKAVSRMDDRSAVDALTRIKGIGPWTAEIYLLMALRRPDIWPSGDIALIRTVQRVKGLREQPSRSTLAEIAEQWKPFRSVAARMFWHHYLCNK